MNIGQLIRYFVIFFALSLICVGALLLVAIGLLDRMY